MRMLSISLLGLLTMLDAGAFENDCAANLRGFCRSAETQADQFRCLTRNMVSLAPACRDAVKAKITEFGECSVDVARLCPDAKGFLLKSNMMCLKDKLSQLRPTCAGAFNKLNAERQAEQDRTWRLLMVHCLGELKANCPKDIDKQGNPTDYKCFINARKAGKLKDQTCLDALAEVDVYLKEKARKDQ